MKKTILFIHSLLLILVSLYGDARNAYLVSTYSTGGFIARDVYVSGDYAYVVASSYGLRMIDISDPENPTEAGYYDTDGYAYGVYIVGNYAYIADYSDGLRIIDVSDITNPTEVGYCDTDGTAWAVYVLGDYAYVADVDSGLVIIDISDSENPTEVGTYMANGDVYGVYVVGDYAYIVDTYIDYSTWDVTGHLRIIDISNPNSPTEVGYYETNDGAKGIFVSGNYAYVAANHTGLRIIDISDPENPTEVGYYITNNSAQNVYVVDNYAYVTTSGEYSGGALSIIDISDVENPVEIGFCDTSNFMLGLYVAGNYAYVAGNSDGMYIVYNLNLVLETFNDGTYYINGTDTIKWIADTSVHQIEISYTTDNGATWDIIDTVDNTGSYAWTIPNTPSDSCMIKLQSLEYSEGYDLSNNLFEIMTGFSLINPQNSDEIERGSYCVIEWESYFTDAYVSIFYSMDNGSSWDVVVNSTEDDGEYRWYVNPDTLGACLLRVILKNSTTVYGDTTISLYISDRVEIVAPNGGEEIDPNTTYRIEWISDSTVEYVNLYYSIDGGVTWNLIEGGIFASLGYYDWAVPDVNTADALIKIEDYSNNIFYDISDSLFTIGNAGVLDLCNTFRIIVPSLSTNGINVRYNSHDSEIIKARIYDMSGRLIREETLHPGQNRNIHVKGNGIYFVRVYDNRKKLLGKYKVGVVK